MTTLTTRSSAPGLLTVFFDGACGLCRCAS